MRCLGCNIADATRQTEKTLTSKRVVLIAALAAVCLVGVVAAPLGIGILAILFLWILFLWPLWLGIGIVCLWRAGRRRVPLTPEERDAQMARDLARLDATRAARRTRRDRWRDETGDAP